jgi:hypothetical protein
MKFYQKLENNFPRTRLVLEGVNFDIPRCWEVASSVLAWSNSCSRCSVSRSEYRADEPREDTYSLVRGIELNRPAQRWYRAPMRRLADLGTNS